jgi:hypothetical protein
MTWEASARIFLTHVAEATKAVRLRRKWWRVSRISEPAQSLEGGNTGADQARLEI